MAKHISYWQNEAEEHTLSEGPFVVCHTMGAARVEVYWGKQFWPADRHPSDGCFILPDNTIYQMMRKIEIPLYNYRDVTITREQVDYLNELVYNGNIKLHESGAWVWGE